MRVDDPSRGAGSAPPSTNRIPRGRRGTKVPEVLARDLVRDMWQLPPGSTLPPESVMLEEYDVGRSSLREALRILEIQGLISIRPGRGGGPRISEADSRVFATTTSLYLHFLRATYQDVMDARLALEPVAARLVAERADHSDLHQLERFIHPRTSSSDEDTRWFAGASDFHTTLIALADNPVIRLMTQSLKHIFTERFERSRVRPDGRTRVEEDHREIARAVLSGNAQEAEKLMRQHMEEFGEYSTQQAPLILPEVVGWMNID